MRRYVLVGRTGVGKSSFVNSFFGEEVAPVDHYEPCTSVVRHYVQPHRSRDLRHDVCLVDTPGLIEGDGTHDATYLEMIADSVGRFRIDGFVYVSPLRHARFPPEEGKAVTDLTARLGPEIWRSSWLALTFAKSVDQEIRTERASRRLTEISELLDGLTRAKRSSAGFGGFRQVVLIDNVSVEWTPVARPLASFFPPDLFDVRRDTVDESQPQQATTDSSAALPRVATGLFPEVRYTLRDRPRRSALRPGNENMIGIDFGTSECRTARMDRRNHEWSMVPCAAGAPRTPSAVYFGDEILAGMPALDFLETDDRAVRVVLNPKRALASDATFPVPGRAVTASQACAALLKKLKHDAEDERAEGSVRRAVIAHPPGMGDSERSALAAAASEAGFEETSWIDEPIAIALAQERSTGLAGDRTLILDLGAGHFAFSLVSRTDEGEFRLEIPSRVYRNAGGSFDESVYNLLDAWAQDEVGEPLGEEGSTSTFQLLRCRTLKEALSQSDSVEANLRTRSGALLRRKILRVEFEHLVRPLAERTGELAKAFLEAALAQAGKIDEALLCGGSSRMPLLRNVLQDALPAKLSRIPNPERLVALGAAHRAQELWGKPGEVPPTRRRVYAQTPLSELVHRLEVREADERKAMEMERQAAHEHSRNRILHQFVARSESIDAEIEHLRRRLAEELGSEDYGIAQETLSRLMRYLPTDPELRKTQQFLDTRVEKVGEVRALAVEAEPLSVSVAPDGRTALVAMTGNVAALLDLSAGEVLKRLTGHQQSVRSVTATADMAFCLSGSNDNTIRIWSLADGVILKQGVHAGEVWHVGYMPDGKRAISCGSDSRILLWNLEDMSVECAFEARTAGMNMADPSPDGAYLLSCSTDGIVRLWDVDRGREIGRLIGHRGNVQCVKFFPGGRLAVTGGDDGTLRVWDTRTSRELGRWEGHERKVWSVAFAPDGRHAISGSDDGTVRVWDVASGWEVRKFASHNKGTVRCVRTTSDGKLAVSCGSDKTVRLWSLGV